MKTLQLFILFTLSLFAEVKSISTGSFNKVDINIPADVTIKRSRSSRRDVLLETDSNTIKKIKIFTKGKTLFIRAKGSFKSTEGIYITINTPHLKKCMVNGSSDIKIGGYSEKSFYLIVDGSSDVSFTSGYFERFMLKTDGSFDINLLDIEIKNATIRAEGTGDIKINVTSYLDIKLKGSIDTKYSGNPKIKKQIEDVSELIPI